jgi:hypothetical protein
MWESNPQRSVAQTNPDLCPASDQPAKVNHLAEIYTTFLLRDLRKPSRDLKDPIACLHANPHVITTQVSRRTLLLQTLTGTQEHKYPPSYMRLPVPEIQTGRVLANSITLLSLKPLKLEAFAYYASSGERSRIRTYVSLGNYRAHYLCAIRSGGRVPP